MSIHSAALPDRGQVRIILALKRLSALRQCDGFLFHRRGAVASRGTFEKIFSQEGNNSAQSLVLRGVNELMQKKIAILPAIGAHKDAVAHSEPAWFRRQEINRVVSGF